MLFCRTSRILDADDWRDREDSLVVTAAEKIGEAGSGGMGGTGGGGRGALVKAVSGGRCGSGGMGGTGGGGSGSPLFGGKSGR